MPTRLAVSWAGKKECWQEFPADADSAYLEIQCGPARTQPERLPLAVGAGAEWIEAYGPLQADHAQMFLKCPKCGQQIGISLGKTR